MENKEKVNTSFGNESLTGRTVGTSSVRNAIYQYTPGATYGGGVTSNGPSDGIYHARQQILNVSYPIPVNLNLFEAAAVGVDYPQGNIGAPEGRKGQRPATTNNQGSKNNKNQNGRARATFNNFYKTKICPWLLRGTCIWGPTCNYAHELSELRACIDLTKTRMCPQLSRYGICQEPQCRFAHDLQELRATDEFFKTEMCGFVQRNLPCPLRNGCRYAHSQCELRPKPTPLYHLHDISRSPRNDNNSPRSQCLPEHMGIAGIKRPEVHAQSVQELGSGFVEQSISKQYAPVFNGVDKNTLPTSKKMKNNSKMKKQRPKRAKNKTQNVEGGDKNSAFSNPKTQCAFPMVVPSSFEDRNSDECKRERKVSSFTLAPQDQMQNFHFNVDYDAYVAYGNCDQTGVQNKEIFDTGAQVGWNSKTSTTAVSRCHTLCAPLPGLHLIQQDTSLQQNQSQQQGQQVRSVIGERKVAMGLGNGDINVHGQRTDYPLDSGLPSELLNISGAYYNLREGDGNVNGNSRLVNENVNEFVGEFGRRQGCPRGAYSKMLDGVQRIDIESLGVLLEVATRLFDETGRTACGTDNSGIDGVEQAEGSSNVKR